MSLEWKGVGPEAEAFWVDEANEDAALEDLLERAIAFGMVMGVRSVGIANLAKEQGLTPITGGEPDWPPPDSDPPSGGLAG